MEVKHIELSTPNFSTMQGVCQHAYPKSPDRLVQVCVEPKTCTVTNPGLPFFLCEILGQWLSPLSLSFFTCKMGPSRPTSEGGSHKQHSAQSAHHHSLVSTLRMETGSQPTRVSA